MKTKTIQQTVHFKAAPQAVYELLMNSKKHSLLSGEKAVISTKVPGKFTAWNGHITGFNLALKPGAKIVQAWRATGWWPDHHSVAIFDIQKSKNGSPFHANRCAAAPIQRPLPRLDRSVLDAYEGNSRKRQDQRTNSRKNQGITREAHPNAKLPAKTNSRRLESR
ncbi:MAG TPA: hypothetical protein VJN89_10190 [Candidatus Acidoferrum sp.]|nr:hypothetical protein [Candidatus Acidoferrum sp.]